MGERTDYSDTMNTAAACALHRFGLGAPEGDLRAAEHDPKGWIHAQLDGPIELPMQLPTAADHLARRRAVARASLSERADIKRIAKDQARSDFHALVAARTAQAVQAPSPFLERLVHFWANHFAVSAGKSGLGPAALAFEFEAIRPFVLGNFSELLLAASSHPAMLIYLDNRLSVGPNSRLAAEKHHRDYGINENHARELLELHTIGISSGYDQGDIRELAKALTGWICADQVGGATVQFHFDSNRHEPGRRTILGVHYNAGGREQGDAVLLDLARHDATARHVCGKLARHFLGAGVAPELIDRLALRFIDGEGDLRPVYTTLIEEPTAFDMPLQTVRSPDTWVLSALRTLAGPEYDAGRLVNSMHKMGQRLGFPPSPSGWPEARQAWAGGAAFRERIGFAHQLGRWAPLETTRIAALNPVLRPATRQALAEAESGAQATALLLLSPEFLQR